MTQPPPVTVDREGVTVPAGSESILDVLFDGRRAFSITPRTHRPAADGRRHVPWPTALAPYLRGRSMVTVREHVDGTPVFDDEVIFDDTDSRVAVVDPQGYPLAVSKWGSLSRTFDVLDSGVGDHLVDDLSKLLSVLNDDLGVEAFLAYGTLLGAVRTGAFIAHDNDADIAYLSRYEHPADIARESFALQRALIDRGWSVTRRSGAFIKVSVAEDVATERVIDVFTAYFIDEMFAVERWIRTELPRASITPLSRIALYGVDLPAPARPEDLLAATYGPQWRVPDPAFSFEVPRSVLRRSHGWYGALLSGHGRWDEAARTETARPPEEGGSEFASWVEPQLGPRDAVVDVGCGAGADAVWFASKGREVLAVDYLPDVVSIAADRAREAQVRLRFDLVTLYDLRAAVAFGARIAASVTEPVLYARLLLDALLPEGRVNFWQMVRTALGGGGRLFLEFRTSRSPDGTAQPAIPPCRCTLDPQTVAAEVTGRGGTVERSDLVVDPSGAHVCRMVTSWELPGESHL